MDREAIITTFERCFPGTQTHTVNRLVGADWLDEHGLTVEASAVRRGDRLFSSWDFSPFGSYFGDGLDSDLQFEDFNIDSNVDGWVSEISDATGYGNQGGSVFCGSYCDIVERVQGDTWGHAAIELPPDMVQL